MFYEFQFKRVNNEIIFFILRNTHSLEFTEKKIYNPIAFKILCYETKLRKITIF